MTHDVIIDRPEAVKLKGLNVPVSHRVHLEVRLVAHHMVYIQYVGRRAVRRKEVEGGGERGGEGREEGGREERRKKR